MRQFDAFWIHTSVKKEQMRVTPGVLICLGSVLFLFGACQENVHSRYDSLRSLQSSSAGARSWFPPILPSSATHLEEWHNIDTNSTVGRFHFDRLESHHYVQSLPKAGSLDFSLKDAHLAMRDVPGWPPCLVGKVDRQRVLKCGYEPFRVHNFQIVIDHAEGTAYFWTD